MQIDGLSDTQVLLLIILVIWEIVWKGFGLWKSARNDDNIWFIAILVVNSVGILPIIYLLLNRNKPSQTNSKEA